MKSIKPGRGPSFMGGITSLLAGLFGVFWIIMACALGGWFMAPFGCIFVAIAVINAVHEFKNASSPNRYSAFDIVDSDEEPDPLNERFGNVVSNVVDTKKDTSAHKDTSTEKRYCPWCGTKVEGDFVFCNVCGKKLP